MAQNIVCCCGDRCAVKTNPGKAHKCYDCDRYMHTICGYPIPEEQQDRGFCYAQICFDCGDKKKNNTSKQKTMIRK